MPLGQAAGRRLVRFVGHAGLPRHQAGRLEAVRELLGTARRLRRGWAFWRDISPLTYISYNVLYEGHHPPQCRTTGHDDSSETKGKRSLSEQACRIGRCRAQMGAAPGGRKPQGGGRTGSEDVRCSWSSGSLERGRPIYVSRGWPRLDVATRRSIPSTAAARPQMSELLLMIEGNLIGRVRADKAGRLSLDYEAGWRESPQGHSISVNMPLAKIIYPHKPVLAYLWNLLPENPNV